MSPPWALGVAANDFCVQVLNSTESPAAPSVLVQIQTVSKCVCWKLDSQGGSVETGVCVYWVSCSSLLHLFL